MNLQATTSCDVPDDERGIERERDFAAREFLTHMIGAHVRAVVDEDGTIFCQDCFASDIGICREAARYVRMWLDAVETLEILP